MDSTVDKNPSTENSEASYMLEEALKQMDGILISSSSPSNLLTTKLDLDSEISVSNVISTAKTLAIALQQVGLQMAPSPELEWSKIIFDWLEPYFQHLSTDETISHYKNKLHQLQNKYRNISDITNEQVSKILELEKQLTDKTQKINNYQDQLRKFELVNSTLENQRLSALSALSELRLQMATLEQENIELKNNVNITTSSVKLFGSRDELNEKPKAPKTPPASFRYQLNNGSQFHSLPRQSICNSNKLSTFPEPEPAKNEKTCKNVAFADSTNVSIIRPNLFPEKVKGIKQIFGKLRRCNSGNLEDYSSDNEFIRGSGVRSTTNGRIEYISKFPANNIKSYRLWQLDDICEWLTELGLEMYIDNCKKWLGNGNHQDLFNVSAIDISKELNLKCNLHRKKIVLALNEVTGKDNDALSINAGRLNTLWAIRWLDDIGLPQYKDAFMRANMDGRMLHRLTMEDLNDLQVLSCLHLASIKSAILVMRQNNWNEDCLIRRSKQVLSSSDEPKNVHLWSAHRVMEWLRAVDLAEYAPNLRGAGVHGGLMYFEPRFNADLLAELLSIPASKTLLRRHLATHFKELLGRDKIQEKRDIENQPNYQALTIASRIKFPKKTQFSLKRRKSSKSTENIWSDYVCPLNSLSNEI